METPEGRTHRDMRDKIAEALAWADGADPIRAEIERHCETIREANDAVDAPGFVDALMEHCKRPPSGYEVEVAAIFYQAGYRARAAEIDRSATTRP